MPISRPRSRSPSRDGASALAWCGNPLLRSRSRAIWDHPARRHQALRRILTCAGSRHRQFSCGNELAPVDRIPSASLGGRLQRDRGGTLQAGRDGSCWRPRRVRYPRRCNPAHPRSPARSDEGSRELPAGDEGVAAPSRRDGGGRHRQSAVSARDTGIGPTRGRAASVGCSRHPRLQFRIRRGLFELDRGGDGGGPASCCHRRGRQCACCRRCGDHRTARDHNALAAGIRALASLSAEERTRLGARARARAVAQFTLKQALASFAAAYLRLA